MPRSKIPDLMVAPNGARRTSADHPALPVTIEATVADAVACFRAGAGGIHAHVRDGNQSHSLDAGLYRELLAELQQKVPQMVVQITTEAAGIYRPQEQQSLVRALRPAHASVAFREITAQAPVRNAARFYHWAAEAEITFQHILYDLQDVHDMEAAVASGTIPADNLELMFVLGRYAGEHDSQPSDISPYLDAKIGALADAEWAACAFGRNETACLVRAHELGGKMRVGFENNLLSADGSLAPNNAARVTEVRQSIGALENA